MKRNLKVVTAHYIEAAVWADAPEDSDAEVSAQFQNQARDDCKDFLDLLEREGADSELWTDEQLGHDFWLTRQGHGTGFWDRGHGDMHSDKPGGVLTKWAKTFSERCVDDGGDGYLYLI